jgi:hypothetical protein
MRRHREALALIFGLMLLESYASQSRIQAAHREGPFVLDELLVAPAEGVSDAELERLYGDYGGTLKGIIPGIGVHLIRVPPATLETVEAAIRASPKVKYVERNFLGTAQ